MALVPVTVFTADRMKAIEDGTIVDGDVVGDDLVLLRHDGTPINAGNVRGPQGLKGDTGSISASPAGGVLSGSYPDPGLAAGAVTDANVAAANKDGAANVASLRTLGTGAQQAAAGNHKHGDTGWIDITPTVAGEAPFATKPVVFLQYRKFGPWVHVRLRKDSSASIDRSTAGSGNFPNVRILAPGTIPAVACPGEYNVTGNARFGDSPQGVVIATDGSVTWIGGFPRNYGAGLSMYCDFTFMTTN